MLLLPEAELGSTISMRPRKEKGFQVLCLTTVSFLALETEACQVLDKQIEILAHRNLLTTSIVRCYCSLHKPKVPRRTIGMPVNPSKKSITCFFRLPSIGSEALFRWP